MEPLMMVKLFLLSILLHLVADYTLQGCLANLKQRDWWTKMIAKEVDSALGKNPSAGKYWHLFRHDYICGLVCHALSWTLAECVVACMDCLCQHDYPRCRG